jgi:dipeptidyl aminopeptidase/acylaminoacyl peptidase
MHKPVKGSSLRRHTQLLEKLIISGLLSSQTLGSPLILQAAQPPTLIPREVLFGNPEIIGVSLSPEGDRIAYLAPYQGVLNLWVRNLDGTKPDQLLTKQTNRPQGVAHWTYDGRYLISSRDSDGDENTVLIRIDPTNGESFELTPSQGVSAIIVAGSDKDAPNEIVVGLNDRDPRYHDLYTLNIDSGERQLLYRSRDDGSRVMVERINGAWQPVLQMKVLPDGGSAYDLWTPSDSNWRPFKRFTFEDTISGSGPLGFTRDGKWLYGILTTGDDLPRLVRWSRDQLHACEMACKPELVHRSSSGGLSIALTNIDNGTPILLQETDLRSRRVILDSSLKRDLDKLSQLASEKEFIIAGRDRNDKTWLVAIGSDQQGPQYWLWNREQQQLRKLFSVQPLLDQYNLVPMKSLNLTARDGLRLPTYLTHTPIATGEPQPLVLIVHGGPQSRDYWDLDPMHQLLANRGYHVMSVNYRGSTGFGKRHLLAGEGEWYARMQDDLVDAVRWAVDQRIADPNRVVIMGASYGGYAALSGLTRDPELFAAAIAEVAPSNLPTLLDSIPPSWESDRAILERMIGVGKVNLNAISPINHVNQIRRPLLLAHGANDPRVNLAESELIAAEMESRGLTIDFVVFPNEGHGLTDPRNTLALVALIEAFLQQHIGGRAEPFGDVLDQSSMDWRLRSTPFQ